MSSYIFSLFTCCRCLSSQARNDATVCHDANNSCSNGHQAILETTATTFNDSNFGVISPDNSLIDVKFDPIATPQTPKTAEIEVLTNSGESNEAVPTSTNDEITTNSTQEPTKRKRKRKIFRRIISLSTTKKKLVNQTDNTN